MPHSGGISGGVGLVSVSWPLARGRAYCIVQRWWARASDRLCGIGSAPNADAIWAISTEVAVLVGGRQTWLGVADPSIKEARGLGHVHPSQQRGIVRGISASVRQGPADTVVDAAYTDDCRLRFWPPAVGGECDEARCVAADRACPIGSSNGPIPPPRPPGGAFGATAPRCRRPSLR